MVPPLLRFVNVAFFTLLLTKFSADILLSGSVRIMLSGFDVESPERVKHIKAHLEKFPDEFPITTNTKDYGVEPILEVHEKEYVDYLQTIYDEWLASMNENSSFQGWRGRKSGSWGGS
jgi:acetoin utilization deacetylase AcuC-like enzyme